MDRFEYTAPTMGTMLKLVVYADSQVLAQKYIDACLDEIERLIPIFNNYSSHSEISKLNSKAGAPIEVSKELYNALLNSRRWFELSEGAFDVTCGALFDLWKSSRKSGVLPSQRHREEAMELCGWKHVQCKAVTATDPSTQNLIVHVTKPGLVLDLSGIATGLIIDAAAKCLIDSGCSRFLIDIGGDIRLGQAPPDRQGWAIQIAGLEKNSPPLMQVRLENCALTTSGDRNQSSVIEGVSYSHLIDPASGIPLNYHQSCTVIADTTIDADAAATTLSILGPMRASKLFGSMPIREATLLLTDTSADALLDPPPSFLRLTQ